MTEVPDDGKVYDRTHGEWVEDEDTPPYDLIEEITLEEDIREFSRSEEPDGTPYNFRRMLVRITKGDKSAFGVSLANYFLFTTLNTNWPFLGLQAVANTADICRAEAINNNNKWAMKVILQHNNGVVRDSLEMPDYIPITKSTERIKKYRCTVASNTPLVAGTKITIYGIR